MSEPSYEEWLRAHDETLKSLIAIIVRIDGYMERVTTNLEVITRLLQERHDDRDGNGV